MYFFFSPLNIAIVPFRLISTFFAVILTLYNLSMCQYLLTWHQNFIATIVNLFFFLSNNLVARISHFKANKWKYWCSNYGPYVLHAMSLEQDFPLLQHLAVIDLSRPISDRRLRSFYSIKLYFKSKPSDLKSTSMINYCVQLCYYWTSWNLNSMSLTNWIMLAVNHLYFSYRMVNSPLLNER
jgi:hypothetical protein